MSIVFQQANPRQKYYLEKMKTDWRNCNEKSSFKISLGNLYFLDSGNAYTQFPSSSRYVHHLQKCVVQALSGHFTCTLMGTLCLCFLHVYKHQTHIGGQQAHTCGLR